MLNEFGLVFNQGITTLRKKLPFVLEDGENELHPLFREALALKYQQLCQLDKLVNELTGIIEKQSRQQEAIRRLQSIPGFGAIIASHFFSVVGDGKAFHTGRDVSASLGLVPAT